MHLRGHEPAREHIERLGRVARGGGENIEQQHAALGERAQRDVARVEKEHGRYAAVGKLAHYGRAHSGEPGGAGRGDEKPGERRDVAQRRRRDSGEVGYDVGEGLTAGSLRLFHSCKLVALRLTELRDTRELYPA